MFSIRGYIYGIAMLWIGRISVLSVLPKFFGVIFLILPIV